MSFSLLSDRAGGVGIVSAAAGAMACVIAALVIDGASAALHARRLQAAADLAAIAAARDLPMADAAARATAAANLASVTDLTTTVGVYRADKTLKAPERFMSSTLGLANAAEVRVTAPAPLWFAGPLLGREQLMMSRTGRAAILAEQPLAMLTIGSRLARVDGGVANAVLSSLTGSDISLTVADYEGLARTRVNLLSVTDLLASDLRLEVGAYDSLLQKNIEAGRLLRIIQRASDGADPALDRLVTALDQRQIRVGDLIGVNAEASDGVRGALNAEVSALDIASAIAEIAAGDRQAKIDLPLRAGLAEIDARIAIGQRPQGSPWLSIDDGGYIVRTAQVRLYVRARTTDAVGGLGRVTLPLIFEGAAAEARLADIRCHPERTVDVEARPGLARARLGEVDVAKLDDFSADLAVRPGVLLEVAGLVRVQGHADLNMSSRAMSRLRFTDEDISSGAHRTVKSVDFVAAPVADLLARADLRVQALGLPINLSGVARAVAALVRPLAGVLDPLVENVLATAGVSLGEADVAVPAVFCPDRPSSPVLVG